MSHVMIVSNDVVGRHMAGPGIRVWEMARALSQRHRVTLAVPGETDAAPDGFELRVYELDGEALRELAARADAIIVQGFILHFFPFLRQAGPPLVVDLYVPFVLESLQWHVGETGEQWLRAYQEYHRVLNEQLRAGDFFICASERQRDYWLGMLQANKRINPHTYADDPTLRRLIDVVPFGLPDDPPQADGPALKGVWRGIDTGDRVVLWGGGLWPWLDPLTVIRAVARVAEDVPNVRLVFPGTRHPNVGVVPETPTVERAVALSREMDLLNRHVFFNQRSWLPYADRGACLLDADVGVSAHGHHSETRFAFRTRLLDYVWAGLPMVVTAGDPLADLLAGEGLGHAVPPGDVGAFADALRALLCEPDAKASRRQAFARLRARLTWQRAVEPLDRFCRAPRHAADRGRYPTELERISRDKDAFAQGLLRERAELVQYRDHLQATLERYHRSLPFRVYFRLKGWRIAYRISQIVTRIRLRISDQR